MPTAELLARAESGDAQAQLEAGRFHLAAAEQAEEGQTARQLAEATRWLTLAAEQDVAEAQTELGVLFVTAEEGARNPAEGRRWLQRAAVVGQTAAIFMLGELAMEGEEDEAPNPVLAVELWREAADGGHTGAQHRTRRGPRAGPRRRPGHRARDRSVP